MTSADETANGQMKGRVFDIQRYSIHDGPGIRTTVFLSGCPLRCKWCQNPESNTADSKLFFLKESCVGCGACVRVCPHHAISIVDGKAHTDRALCEACGICTTVCIPEGREVVGETMTVDEVVAKALEDKMFYDGSGGGVTLSGGEVLMQPDFAAAILKRCKDEGVHTCIETCGFAKWERFEKILPYVDLVFYDFKNMDSKKHEEGTGIGNELILENAARVYNEARKPMHARVPTIPGYNDSDENMEALADFILEKMGPDVEVNLLPYHSMGDSKNDRMEMPEEGRFEAKPPSNEHMEHLRSLLEARGLTATIGG